MSEVFLSYIVPCYNVEKYLPRCIESLKQQFVESYDLEFIMVNDGSTDGTISLINEFAESDKRVVVVDQENLGVCKARNNGLKVARGEYVFFLDGDDYMTDNAAQIIRNFSSDSNPDIAMFGNYKIHEGRPDTGEVWSDCSRFIVPGVYDRKTYIEKTKKVPVSSKLYKTEFLRTNNIEFDEALKTGEVYTFFIHALTKANVIGVSADFIMYYLKRKGGSATAVIDTNRDMSILDTLHVITRYTDNYPLLLEKRSFIVPFFWLITSFSIIKYVGRTKYDSRVSAVVSALKKENDYKLLLDFLTTGKGFRLDTISLIAAAIKYLPIRICYNLLKLFYKMAAKKSERNE